MKKLIVAALMLSLAVPAFAAAPAADAAECFAPACSPL